MKLAPFTNPLGQRVLVNPEQVVNVRPAAHGEFLNAMTVIILTSGLQAVTETVEQVEAALK